MYYLVKYKTPHDVWWLNTKSHTFAILSSHSKDFLISISVIKITDKSVIDAIYDDSRTVNIPKLKEYLCTI